VVDIDTMTNSGLSLDLDFRIFDAAFTFLFTFLCGYCSSSWILVCLFTKLLASFIHKKINNNKVTTILL
jgi:aerobic-type carbon monoxide dehydrogenase small subunit (CoxS/CutS family)